MRRLKQKDEEEPQPRSRLLYDEGFVHTGRAKSRDLLLAKTLMNALVILKKDRTYSGRDDVRTKCRARDRTLGLPPERKVQKSARDFSSLILLVKRAPIFDRSYFGYFSTYQDKFGTVGKVSFRRFTWYQYLKMVRKSKIFFFG